MSLRRIVYMFVAAFMLIITSYLVTNSTADPNETGRASLDLEGALVMPRAKTTNELIGFWQDRFKENPQDFISLTYLGQTFMSRARETGDVGDYLKAETAFYNALEIDPKYENAQGYLSSALFAVHDFQGALDQAKYVYSSDPRALLVLETIGDAQMELGNYVDAETAFKTLFERVPSPPVYARLARLAWLKGNPTDALNWMQRAVDEAGQAGYAGEEAAWYEFQLGELYFSIGRIEDAEKHYSAALNFFNNYHFALTGLGKVRAAQGHYSQAIDFYQRAVSIIPQPVSLAALGDLYAVVGSPEQAKQQYDTVDFIGKLAAVNRIVYNRELALFDANHDRKLDEALDLAANELAIRKDIYGYDTMAWALYKQGRFQEAALNMDHAMQLGTQDALLYYHAGMIYEGLGDHSRAKSFLTQAMTINPHFDLLQARLAQATLDRLQSN